MKKLLKGMLSFGIAAIMAIPQINAATTPSYVIEVKSKKYSKQTTKNLYGLVYTEAYSSYGDANWPLVECYTPFVETNDAFIATDGSGTTKKFLIRQFGVSMGVVYWINPTQNVIHYWNTFTGEVGTDTPEKGLRGSATPSKHKGLNYACGDIPGQTGFAYPFSGAQTGVGSVTQDWGGNIIHQWNNVSGANINTPTQGFAVYRAPEKYGQLIDFEPRLSDMTTQTMPYYRRKIGTNGLLEGSESDLSGSYELSKEPNPNWVGNQVYWVKNEYYHAYNEAYAGSKKQPVDFMGASGNLFDNAQNVNSEYFYGNWGGQIFLTYRGITFGNMFADGQYANWYLNYDLYINSKPISAVELTDTTYTITQNGTTTTSSKYKPGAYSFSTYSREYMFRECGVLNYFWSMPVSGFYEMVSRPTYKWTFDPCVLEKDENGTNLSMYTSSHPRYGYNMTNGYDAMNVPEIDSIKGHRVLIHNMWLQYWPENIKAPATNPIYNMRDGQIQIRSCSYSGGYNATTGKWTGNPTEAYAQVGYGYGYNKQTNDYVNVLGTNFTATNTSVNCWSELERVNDNVLALYTNVPGKGFSKYYITAVEQDNPVTITGITQTMDANNNIINTISWTPQEHDRGTIHRYQVYYRVKQSGASVYEKAETIDGATQYPWTLAGVTEYEGKYAGQTLTFNHNAPYGGTDINSYYDRVYEYMVMPIYDASSHYGTESAVVTKTSEVPDCYIDGTFNQETETVDGITRYSFNVKLDPVIMAGTPSITSISRMIIEPLDATTAAELKKATGVTASAGTVTANEGSATFTANGVSVTTSNNYYVEATGFTVGADGKLPSIVWHNVDPDITYNVKVYVEDTPTAFVVPSEAIDAFLEIPYVTLSLTEASVYPLVGDYSSLQKNDLLPLGAKRKVGSNEVTNPVSLKNANTLGTKGSAINPLLVTDEVLENWDVQYKYNIFKGGDYLVHYDLDASNVSNNKKVMWDIVGFPVERTAWNTHDKMGLSDAQKATNENITKYGYNTSTVPDDANGYTAYIDVTFTRKDNSEITASKSGEQEASSSIVFSDAVKDGSIFPDLGVSFGSQFVPVKRDDTHWDENCPEDAENNYGYYTVYYDAFAQWEWGEYADNLNRYVGFHAVTSTNCVGHYVNNSSTWIPYYAPSVLSDDWVVEANITLGMDGNFTDNYNGAVEPLVMREIGYDGTANTDWSALAAKERTLPMQVHYVWGGNRVLTNDLSDRETTSTKVLMTADYPIIEFVWNGTSVPTLIPNTGDESYYTLIPESEAGYTRMNMVSSENHSGVFADYVTTVTGVEGILTNACGGWQLYPNPVGSVFTLEAPMTIGDVQIFSMDGQLVKVVKDVKDTTVKINVDELPQGVYIVNTLGIAKLMIKQ